MAADNARESIADMSEEPLDEYRQHVVLIVEAQEVTKEEWEQLLVAIRVMELPLGVAERVRLHVAIKDVADRVMEAFDGTG